MIYMDMDKTHNEQKKIFKLQNIRPYAILVFVNLKI